MSLTTLAVNSPGSATAMAESQIAQLIMVKTNINGYFFDAYLKLDHTSKLTITTSPVQTGAAIADHAYLEPAELTIQVGMSDVMKSIIQGQFSNGKSRSIEAYKVLQQLQAQRIPLQVVTKIRIYQNMLIESIEVPEDYTTIYGLKATVTFKELLVGTVQTVKMSAKPQTTNSTKKGTAQPVQPNQSILKQIQGMVGGN